MLPLLFVRLFILAQSDDVLGDFLWQVRGLIAFICVLGILWVALLVLTIQRRGENKRRERLGMDPLPNMWVGLYRWATGQAEPSTRGRVAAQTSPVPPPSTRAEPLPAPDLDLLTGAWDEDDARQGETPDRKPTDDATPRVQPEPARSAPAAIPAAQQSEPTPDIDAATLEQEFMFDDDPQAMSSRRPDDVPRDAVDVLRVFRDVSDGKLIVVMDGQPFSTVDEMRSADLERRFTKIVRELAILVRDAQQTSKRPPPSRRTPRLEKSPRAAADDENTEPQPEESVPRPTPQVPTPEDQQTQDQPPQQDVSQQTAPVEPVQPRPPAQAAPADATPSDAIPSDESPGTTATLPDDDLPSMAPGAMLRGMTRAAFGPKPETPTEDEPTPTEPLSIADQIDALLQARLRQLPEYRERTISVKTSPLGGVRIQVDDEFFEGVGEVTDDEVRALLQDVVREWEQRG